MTLLNNLMACIRPWYAGLLLRYAGCILRGVPDLRGVESGSRCYKDLIFCT